MRGIDYTRLKRLNTQKELDRMYDSGKLRERDTEREKVRMMVVR